MSLIDDLGGIDLSGLLNARGTISVSLDVDIINDLIQNGALQSAMGSFGSGIGKLQVEFDKPENMIKPLVDKVLSIEGVFNLEDLPISDYIKAVSDLAAIVVDLFEGSFDKPENLGKILGFMSGSVFPKVASNFEGFTNIDLGGISQFRTIIQSIENDGVSTQPLPFAELALDMLLPFPRANIQQLSTTLDSILSTAGSISLPTTRTEGLVLAFNQVTLAANTGNALQLQTALANLQVVRTNTVVLLKTEFDRIAGLIEGIPIESLVAPLETLSSSMKSAEQGILEFLKSLERNIDVAAVHVDAFDADKVREGIEFIFDAMKTYLKKQLLEPINLQVDRTEAWVRSLFNQIPLRKYRQKVTDLFKSIAEEVENSGLDEPAKQVRELLNTIENTIDPVALKTEIEGTLNDIQSGIDAALGPVIGALGTVKTEIDSISGTAKGILEQALSAFSTFRVTTDEITVSIDKLGIDAAAQQVVNTLSDLRSVAESLFSVAPLPDSVKPLVEQLITAVEGIDLDIVLEPVRAVAEELKIPESVGGTVNGAIQKASEILENLIPDEVISGIENEINGMLEQLNQFDPTSFLDELDSYVDETKTLLLGLDPRPIVQEIRGPYQDLLDKIDQFHPLKILEPVIETYDSLIDKIEIPSTEGVVRQTHDAISRAGETLSAPLRETISRAAGGEDTPASNSSDPQSGPISPPPPDDTTFKAGDIIRIIGYVPQKLKEALDSLGESEIGEILSTIDSFTGGLALKLRSLSKKLFEIENRIDAEMKQLLAPVMEAQRVCENAIFANFRDGSIDLEASMGIIKISGSASLRRELEESKGRAFACLQLKTSGTSATIGVQLERAARALERMSISKIGDDASGLLEALNVEDLAVKVDELVLAVVAKVPGLLGEIGEEIEVLGQRFRGLFQELNPATLAQKFLRIIGVIKEQLELLDPERLAIELGEIHSAIKSTIEAYDPAIFADEIYDIIENLAAALDLLKPSDLLSDFTFDALFLDKIKNVVPTEALKEVDQSLNDVGAELAAIDLSGLFEAINNLAPRLVDDFDVGLNNIKDEVVALLEAIKYQQSNASASVSVSGSVGIG